MMAASATAASFGVATFGIGKLTVLSRLGRIRSKHIRSATTSPPMASSMAFRVSAFAPPSSSDSAMRVALLRQPLARPRGLPL